MFLMFVPNWIAKKQKGVVFFHPEQIKNQFHKIKMTIYIEVPKD